MPTRSLVVRGEYGEAGFPTEEAVYAAWDSGDTSATYCADDEANCVSVVHAMYTGDTCGILDRASPGEMRWYLAWRDDGDNCAYCGVPLSDGRRHVDHVLARACGGTDDPENLVLACPGCNLSKGARLLGVEWLPTPRC